MGKKKEWDREWRKQGGKKETDNNNNNQTRSCGLDRKEGDPGSGSAFPRNEESAGLAAAEKELAAHFRAGKRSFVWRTTCAPG